MYLVRKANSSGFLILSDEKPKLICGQKTWSLARKFRTKAFTRDILSSYYYSNLKQGDWIPWAVPTEKPFSAESKIMIADIDEKVFQKYVVPDIRYTKEFCDNIFPTFLYRVTKNGVLFSTYPMRRKYYIEGYEDEVKIDVCEGLADNIVIPNMELVFYPSKDIEPLDLSYSFEGIGRKKVYPIFKSLDACDNAYFPKEDCCKIWWGHEMTINEINSNSEKFEVSIINNYIQWYNDYGEKAQDFFCGIEDSSDNSDRYYRNENDNDWMDNPDDYWNID